MSSFCWKAKKKFSSRAQKRLRRCATPADKPTERYQPFPALHIEGQNLQVFGYKSQLQTALRPSRSLPVLVGILPLPPGAVLEPRIERLYPYARRLVDISKILTVD